MARVMAAAVSTVTNRTRPRPVVPLAYTVEAVSGVNLPHPGCAAAATPAAPWCRQAAQTAPWEAEDER